MSNDTDTAEADAPTFNPLSDAHTSDPYGQLARLRDEAPVLRSEDWGLWVVTPYDEVKAALGDPEAFSSETPNTGAGAMCPMAAEIVANRVPVPGTLVTLDDPAHANNKRPIQRALSAKRIKQMAGHIEELAQSFLDGFKDRGSVEFVEEFAGPLPATVIAELLGIPRDVHPRFKVWADALKVGLSADLTEQEQVDWARNTMESDAYLLGLIAERRAEPKDDFVAELVAAVRPDGRPFDDQEILSIAIQFLVAGHETTSSTLASMVYYLATHPELADSLRADPTKHDGFIEETLRFFTPVQGRYRVATKDVCLRDVDIPKGDRLHFSIGAANHDSTHFPDADTFDPERENVKDHLTFGYGIHFCIGSEIARLECRIGLRLLLAAMDNIRLADGADPSWGRHFHLRGLTELPLVFDPTS